MYSIALGHVGEKGGGFAHGHACGVRVDGASPRRFLRFLGLTALRAEGCGGGFAAIKRGAAGAAGCVEGLWKKVLKMDGSSTQGFLSLTGPLAPRVVVSPLRAMNIKSALRDLLFVSYGMKNNSADWLAALASPLSGCAFGHTCGVRILKMDRPAAGGFVSCAPVRRV